jgi:hypothetical protein
MTVFERIRVKLYFSPLPRGIALNLYPMKYMLLFAACWLLILSCGNTAMELQPVSDKEAAEYAAKIEASVMAGDVRLLDNAIDKAVFYKKIDSSTAYGGEKGVNRKFMEGVFESMKLGDQIMKMKGENGSFALVRRYQKAGTQHLLYRFFELNTGIVYMDFELVKRKNKVAVADVFNYNTGENFSQSVKQAYVQFKRLEQKNGFDGATDAAKEVPKLKEMMQQDQYKEVIASIDALPPAIRQMRVILLMRVQAAATLNDGSADAAVAEYRRFYPDYPEIDLQLLDGYFVSKNYRAALRCVDNLDRQLEGDPFLNYYRGLVYGLMNKNDSALYCIEKAAVAEPGIREVQTELLYYYHKNNQKEKAKQLLQRCIDEKVFDQKTIDEIRASYPDL